MNAEQIASTLFGKKSGRGWLAHCPAHDDSNPSLSIEDGPNGTVLVHCHAGCSQEDVITALRDMDLWLQSRSDQSAPALAGDKYSRVREVPASSDLPDVGSILGFRASEVYEYRSTSGGLVGLVARIDTEGGGKTFRPITPWRNSTGDLIWRAKGFGDPLPVFHQNKVAARPDAPILVVEGERTAKAAQALFPEMIVLTWPGGAKVAAKADWGILWGRDVTLWPDADDPGRSAMAGVAQAADAAGAMSIKLVELPSGLPRGWDLADMVPAGMDPMALIASAKDCSPSLSRFVISAPALSKMTLPPREFIIGRFMPTQGLSMVYAERGLGKTWLCMTLALSVAKGESFLGYDVPKARRVLYIDGEMALVDLRDRLKMLADQPPDELEFLPSELLYKEDRPLNLNSAEDQARVVEALDRRKAKGQAPELVIVDNLSSLTRGVDENSNSELDALLMFLTGLRHRGYSVLLVHHAGKNGTQRGASRREDLLDLSIELRKPDQKKDKRGSRLDHDGAHFVMEFAKVRGRKPNPPVRDLKLREIPEGRVEWLVSDAPVIRQADEVLLRIAEVRPNSQKDLAVDLDLTQGRVSQICKALRDGGLVVDRKSKEGRSLLALTEIGFDRLSELWPSRKFDRNTQDDFPI